MMENSARSPLSFPAFRALWTASLVANVGFWMQNVAAGWLMTELSGSSLMVAMTQTAISLPAFIFGLPAGVLADQLDSRRLLLAIYAWIVVVGVLLLAFVESGEAGPWSLLCLVFLGGIGSALSLPVWQAATPGLLPRDSLVSAVALNSVAYNGARAVGPAIAGGVIAAQGSMAVFAMNAGLLLLAFGILLLGYRPETRQTRPREGAGAAMLNGLDFVFKASYLHGYLRSACLFVGCASALWALLPLSALHLGRGAAGINGYLLASLGCGAVLGGLLLSWLRGRYFSLESLLCTAALLLAVSMLAMAWLPNLLAVCGALGIGGVGWVLFCSPLNAAFQRELSPSVRARAISIFLLVFQGATAVGGFLWGALAELLGVPATLSIAAACLMLCLSMVAVKDGRRAEFADSASRRDGEAEDSY